MNITVAAFSGSLRKESYTTKLVKAFQKHAPEGVTLKIIEIGNLPLINQDLENDTDLPQSVKDLRASIREADAILWATPEYNRSYSPVLKNAIDWGSRPPEQNTWNKKPLALIGCSPYSLGGFGATHHLRQTIVFINAYPMQQPEFYLSQAAEKFDKEGNLTDEVTLKHIQDFWTAFVEWIEKVR